MMVSLSLILDDTTTTKHLRNSTKTTSQVMLTRVSDPHDVYCLSRASKHTLPLFTWRSFVHETLRNVSCSTRQLFDNIELLIWKNLTVVIGEN